MQSTHKCTYCGIDSPGCLIQCKDCRNWFCNGGTDRGGSHAVSHLVKARHKNIKCGKRVIKCYSCGGSNVFVLGYIQTKAKKKFLLCRIPCALKGRSNGITWDPEKWNPLISEGLFDCWLAKVPAPKIRGRQSSPKQIDKSEEPSNCESIELSSDNKNKLEVVGYKSGHQLGVGLQNQFENGIQYFNKFWSLNKMDVDYQIRTKDRIKVKWIQNKTKGTIKAFFTFTKSESDMNITFEDDLTLYYLGGKKWWSGRAYVNKVSTGASADEQEVGIVMVDNVGVPTECTSNFVIELFWETIAYQRYGNE